MIGSGDEDHIITRVVPGTDPLQDFEDDDLQSQTIIIDHDTDASSDVDDLSGSLHGFCRWYWKTGVPMTLVRHRSTAPANGGFSGCPGLEG